MLYVGIAIREDTLKMGIKKSIEYALQTINSEFINVIYYDYTLTDNLIKICDKFLVDSSDSNYKVFITESSDDIIESDNYFNKQLKLNVICFSTSASSDSLSNILTEYAMTYGYFNQNLIKSFFLILKSYNVYYAALFFDPDSNFSIYQQDLIQQFEIQSSLLGIPYKIISILDKNFHLLPNTGIFIICETLLLKKYINQKFLNKIKESSFILLPDISENCPDIFEKIPAFISIFWPPNYTTTSFNIYKYVNIKNSTFQIYPIFQIIYTLAKLSLNPLFFKNDFDINVYLSFNAFSTIPTPWIPPYSFNINKRGPVYGWYSNIFTKNIFFKGLNELYYKNFLGGCPSTDDSFSLFCRCGIVPWTYCNFNIQFNNPIYIYKDNLIIIKNSYDTTEYNSEFISESINSNYNVFLYKYNQKGYFIKLKFIPSAKKVNTCMSIFKQKYLL